MTREGPTNTASDRLTALDALLPSGRDGVLVTALVTADGEDTLSVGRRGGEAGAYLELEISGDRYRLKGRAIADGACPHQAATLVCAALGVSEEYRRYREDVR